MTTRKTGKKITVEIEEDAMYCDICGKVMEKFPQYELDILSGKELDDFEYFDICSIECLVRKVKELGGIRT